MVQFTWRNRERPLLLSVCSFWRITHGGGVCGRGCVRCSVFATLFEMGLVGVVVKAKAQAQILSVEILRQRLEWVRNSNRCPRRTIQRDIAVTPVKLHAGHGA